MNEAKYIGLDVHQATISIAILVSTRKLAMEAILETKGATIRGLRVFVERPRLHPLSRKTQPRAAALDRAREKPPTK